LEQNKTDQEHKNLQQNKTKFYLKLAKKEKKKQKKIKMEEKTSLETL